MCGDTVFLAVYLCTAKGFKYTTTFSNLYTPMVQDYNNLDWLVKNCKDEYISRYAWDNQMWVNFKGGSIVVPFAIGLTDGYDFVLEYNLTTKNWHLTQKRKWRIPEGGYEIVYDSDSKIEVVKTVFQSRSFELTTTF